MKTAYKERNKHGFQMSQVPGEVMSLARHQYGCRILQRLLENCQGKQMEGQGVRCFLLTSGVVALLLEDALPLVRHGYATFVMQARCFDPMTLYTRSISLWRVYGYRS